jgi:hypothetical protein
VRPGSLQDVFENHGLLTAVRISGSPECDRDTRRLRSLSSTKLAAISDPSERSAVGPKLPCVQRPAGIDGCRSENSTDMKQPTERSGAATRYKKPLVLLPVQGLA